MLPEWMTSPAAGVLAGSRVRRAPPCALRYPNSALNDRQGRRGPSRTCRLPLWITHPGSKDPPNFE